VQYVLLATIPALAVITLLLLPRVKGAVIGVQWAIRTNDGKARARTKTTLGAAAPEAEDAISTIR